jgi:ribulose-phosphate 3-epimerase
MAAPATAFLRSISPTLSAGILTANLADVGGEVRLLERVGIRLVHFDVMDGCFCPMMTLGPPVIKAVKTSMWKDVHLMIADPLEKIRDYVSAGADIITVHVEACRHIHRLLQALGTMKNANDPERSLVRGTALNPGTPLDAIEPVLHEVELLLILAVNPGWSGQAFLPSTPARVCKARQMIASSGKDILIGVDGGITRANVAEVAAGADLIVSGSAVFDGKAPAENAIFMLESLQRRAAAHD